MMKESKFCILFKEILKPSTRFLMPKISMELHSEKRSMKSQMYHSGTKKIYRSCLTQRKRILLSMMKESTFQNQNHRSKRKMKMEQNQKKRKTASRHWMKKNPMKRRRVSTNAQRAGSKLALDLQSAPCVGTPFPEIVIFQNHLPKCYSRSLYSNRYGSGRSRWRCTS